jgi:hypothetical protein
LNREEGDTGWSESGREAGGGAMVMNFEPPPSRKLPKELVDGNESATGPELASAPKMLAGAEVIGGRRWPERSGKRPVQLQSGMVIARQDSRGSYRCLNL